MFPTQIVATHRRLPGLTALMVATAFALGALTALGAQRVLDQGTQAGVASGVATLAPRGDMSAAAYAAMHASSTRVGPASIVPARDMSSAAYAATHPAAARANDMSAAAYAAWHPDATGR